MKLHWAIMLSNGSITAYWCLETLKKQLRNMQLRNMQLYYNATEFDERACPNPCSSPKAFRGFNSFLSFSAAEVRGTRTRVPTRVRVRIQNRLLSCFISNFFFCIFDFIEVWIDSYELNMKNDGFGNFFGHRTKISSVLIPMIRFALAWMQTFVSSMDFFEWPKFVS